MFALIFAALLGLFIGITLSTSRSFSEGGGLGLVFFAIFAFVIAGICGIASPFVPTAIAVWLTRIIVFLVLFLIGILAPKY